MRSKWTRVLAVAAGAAAAASAPAAPSTVSAWVIVRDILLLPGGGPDRGGRRWYHECFSTRVGSMAAGDIEVLPRRPRPNMRQELRASQRGRLICAVADAVAAKGYAATSVADVIALAGV